jgi:hypothetical protein
LRDRFVVMVGSAHGSNSFRVGSKNPAVTHSPLAAAPRGVKVYADIPEFRLQAGGIAPYYGDTVLIYDTVERKYSRAGVVPYGLITSHCANNQVKFPVHFAVEKASILVASLSLSLSLCVCVHIRN